MLNLTSKSRHAVRAMIELAHTGHNKMLTVAELGERLEVSAGYLGRLLNTLVREGILHSRRGHDGGFRLATSAANITLYDIVSPLEDLLQLERCVLNPKGCDAKKPCAFHMFWSKQRRQFMRSLSHVTLAELAAR